MKTEGGSDGAKRRAGERAAAAVEDGDVVGLGTGSTAAHAIRAIGRAVDDGLAVRGIPTSFQSRQLALEVGIPISCLEAVDGIDLAIDGADQIADDSDAPGYGALLKGGGAAHTREKMIDSTADRFVVVADASKLSGVLEKPVALEVIPDARTIVADEVRTMGGEPTLRDAAHKDGPVVTDNGNLVLDCAFDEIDAPDELATRLSSVPGVVEHGLFVGMADAAYVGTDDGLEVREY
ncbi:ribose-5-phosphate isomerase RpiA [Natrarchaeobius sp. A-rgal3]|uniref:ribose-5-phosphate isomerase RpiA n=1 Tax=Natrarchaeobius versutus TaxID=1679078 RepID=UPI00350ED8C4